MQAAATSPLPILEKLKTQSALRDLTMQLTTLGGTGPLVAFKRVRIGGQMRELLVKLGMDFDGPAREAKAFEAEKPEALDAPRKLTADLYDFDQNRLHSQRKKDNAAAMALLRQIDAGEVAADALTDDQKRTLAKYSGTGGNLEAADGKKGSAYEYYTPKPIAEGMWALLGELGFKGGKVLDPCSAVGIFGATAPANAAIESVELDKTSGRINQLVNGGPGYVAHVSPFEAVASRTGDELYDAVVTNVPFGGVHDRGSNRMIDPRYQDQPLETYFILRSLEKLKPGGLAAFIVPPRVVSAKGGREEQLRMQASFMAEFMGAYRLPNSVFGTADADTITDVIVFRKFGRAAAEKIGELREQNPGALVAANVLWSEFIDGRYFQGEGKRFVLGEFVAKDTTKFRDVDRVVSDQSVTNIGKLLRRFPGSRIDWKAIEATETEPIAYNDGDTMTLAGQTLEMRDGVWVALAKAESDSTYDDLGVVLSSPLAAVSNAVNWEQASQYVAYLGRRSLDLRMPVWLRMAHNDVSRVAESDRATLWSALTSGLAVVDVMQEHSGEPAFNYLEAYPVLSDAIKANASVKAPASFSRDSKAAFIKASIVYTRKAGFSALWRGDVAAEVDVGVLDTTAKVNALIYVSGADVDVAKLKATLGDDFDVMASDDWCLDATGSKARKADDYYVGNYAEFLRRIDAEIQAAESAEVREKLLRQRAVADARVERLDPHVLRYNLFTPFVTLEEKAEFLRRFLDPHFVVGTNNLGEPYILWDGPSSKNQTTEQKLMSRIASYLSGDAGGRGVRSLTLQGKDVGLSDREALAMLRKYAQRINTQFDSWVKANPVVMDRLTATANDPEKLYFTEVDDNTPVEIPGLHPDLALHGYQNAFTRKMGRSFGGINGYDVGLGKTFTALACAQYVQSIGVKKKTIFAVPNAVLSNWRVEVGRAYANLDDCLFIGLEINEKTGEASVNSANYARDFHLVLENKHRKIFCTMEAFSMIPLKAETIEAYEAYMTTVDPSFAPTEKRADSERAASKLAQATSGTGAKSSAVPFFEDMGVDSLVLDEAHAYKNSKNTVEFSGAKFLSVAEASQRGLDMQMKAWYVRGLTSAGDGVLPLTATPITNSPLEIYSMLTLAAGEKKVHDLCMGVEGADAFMDAMCMIEDAEDIGIDGTMKNYRVFTGLQNVALLRNAIGAIATIKTGKDVALGGDDLKLPDAPERQTAVNLPEETRQRLLDYKLAYRAAREQTGTASRDAEPVPPEAFEALKRVQDKFGEDLELIGHPFNLIQKMTALIADPELDERATFYSVLAAQKPAAEATIAAFNKLKKEEVRARPGPWTSQEAVLGQKTVRDGANEVTMVRIKPMASFAPDGRVVIDTLDYNTQAEFERLAEKNGLDLDASIPPKLAALLQNVKDEEANPRSVSGRVKQLVFCDILPMHNKIKRVLSKHAGIPASAIAIISGQSISNPEQMQDIQDGFNAEGEANRLRAIVANEKAEVGINLQKGTQAIHHMTIGWTPDSQHQRNGRGVRQGNTTSRVNIYHYDADGTFDEYKRTLTAKKADWIGAVMDKQGENEVQVSGGLSNEQYEELIESMGDATAIQAIQDRAAMRERLQRAESARQRQVISLQTAQSQRKFLAQYDTFDKWVGAMMVEAFDLSLTLKNMRTRNTSKMKAETLVRFQSRIAEMEAALAGKLRDLDSAGTWQKNTPTDWIVGNVDRYGYSDNKFREMLAAKAAAWNFKPTEGSSLHDEWASQRAMAEQMADEADKEFARVGKQGGGAYDPRVADAMKNGQGMLLDGQPVVKGMFVRDKKGNLAIVTGDRDHVGRVMAVRFPDIKAGVADLLRGGGKLVGFESPEYEAAVIEAARIDDAAKDVSERNEHLLFASVSSAVAERRTVRTLVSYDAYDHMLPSPHFQFPIDPSDAERASPVVKGIIEAQGKLIQSWSKGKFTVPAGSGIEKAEYGAYSPEKKAAALAGHARGLGQRATLADLCITLGRVVSKTALPYAKHTFKRTSNAAGDRFNAATTREEVRAISRELIEAACDWITPEDDWTLADVMPPESYSVVGAFNGALRRIADAERTAEIAAAQAAYATAERSEQYRSYQKHMAEMTVVMPSGIREQIMADERLNDGEAEDLAKQFDARNAELVVASVQAAGDIVVSAAGRVGLTGQTMQRVRSGGETKPVKDFIKAASEESGSKAKWRGDKLQWDVTPEALAVLRGKYPEAAQLVTVVPAIE